MTYLTTGNPDQRRKTLHLFLTNKSIIIDTEAFLGEVLPNKEAIAGLICLQSMKMILSKIFRSRRGQISSNKRQVVTLLTACIINLVMISFGYKVQYTRCVEAPSHGKKEVNGLIGTEKTYADTIFARPGQGQKMMPTNTI